MLHSIIIPYRNRPRRLKLCLERIAHVCRISEDMGGYVEVVIVNETLPGDGRFDPPFNSPLPIRWLHVRRTGKMFNKPRLLNAGIEASAGNILTFLDVDSLIGDRFFEAAEWALSPRITKMCYRVRPLAAAALDKAEADPGYIDACFDKYDTFGPPRFEAYQLPDLDLDMKCGGHIFGNSQFSISREKLGDIRFDESYEGAGFEDIAMNLKLWLECQNYQGAIVTDADHAMLDIQNTREPDWYTEEQHAKNGEQYRNSCPWNALPENSALTVSVFDSGESPKSS